MLYKKTIKINKIFNKYKQKKINNNKYIKYYYNININNNNNIIINNNNNFGDWGLGIGDWGLGPIPNPQLKILFINFFFKFMNFIQ